MRVGLLLLLLLSLLACVNKPELPISESKMAEILRDMLVAEASMKRVTRKVKDSLEQVYQGQIYKMHEVDSAQLANCFKVMQADPELSQNIYRKAEALLVDQETSFKKEKEKAMEKPDEKSDKKK